MFIMDYVVEKEGIALSYVDHLFLNESHLNHLLDSYVSEGFDIVSTYIRKGK